MNLHGLLRTTFGRGSRESVRIDGFPSQTDVKYSEPGVSAIWEIHADITCMCVCARVNKNVQSNLGQQDVQTVIIVLNVV